MTFIRKRNGQSEEFDRNKIDATLKKIGVSKSDREEIIEKVEQEIYNGISTKKIYSLVFKALKSQRKRHAIRYSLKSAMEKLGPEGHKFEDFMAHVFIHLGYNVEIRKLMQGFCVSHEIDLLIEKGGKTMMVECKFHQRTSTISAIQTVLYVHSRFNDLVSNPENRISMTMVATNTRFSREAIKYAKCYGMSLLGWRYPPEKSLEQIIDGRKLYPITILPSLRRKDVFRLMDREIFLAKELLSLRDDELEKFLGRKRFKKVKDEIYSLG